MRQVDRRKGGNRCENRLQRRMIQDAVAAEKSASAQDRSKRKKTRKVDRRKGGNRCAKSIATENDARCGRRGKKRARSIGAKAETDAQNPLQRRMMQDAVAAEKNAQDRSKRKKTRKVDRCKDGNRCAKSIATENDARCGRRGKKRARSFGANTKMAHAVGR